MTIIHHPSFDVIDSSKIQEFLMCPRYFFYRYMLGWVGEEPNHDLIFGEAWHAAMLQLALKGYSEENTVVAFGKFMEIYRATFPEESDELWAPKTPMNALKGLVAYTSKYANDPQEFEVLYAEVGGTVSLAEDRFIAFRQDTICRGKEGIFSLEHKTTAKSFNQSWFNQWLLKTQFGTYNHVLHCLFENEKIEGVKVNGASFMKTKLDFERRLIVDNLSYMQNWQWNTLYWIDQIYWNYDKLNTCKEDDPILFSFPMNTESCTKYWGCRYLDLCRSWSNPLQHCDVPPVGTKVEYWNPLEEKITTKVEDGRIV